MKPLHLLIIALLLAGCGGAPATAPTPAPTPVSGRLTFAGSTTMQPLVEKLAAQYRARNAGVEPEIAAGGSLVGINAVQDGRVDIGMASRELKPSEQRPDIETFVIAYDALVIIAHPSNPVRALTRAQIQDIYSGRVTNWRQVGGADMPVVPVVREVSSGTRGAFDELVMNAQPLVANPSVQVTAGEVEALVARTPGAIGYVGFGNVQPDVAVLMIDGVTPSPQTVKQGVYRLTRPLSLLVGPLSRPLARAFVAFALSPDGQQLVAQDGWVAAQR